MNHQPTRCLFVPVLFLIAFATANSYAQLPAFPGAQGFGRFATGGRGGSVYFVTTTNDSGAGSFRDAVSVSVRTVIFRVGGVIDYQAPRYAPKPNITIAGQTAPGDGVTIYGNGLSFSGANNTITRFIRVREGINGDSDTDAIGIANGNTMIFDHITASWGRDETFSISGSDPSNITIQSSIISQGLQGHS
ncbi:MAG: pectate lyase, partial [Verrucomicrobiota bacterium]